LAQPITVGDEFTPFLRWVAQESTCHFSAKILRLKHSDKKLIGGICGGKRMSGNRGTTEI
jgi:hypothetical protein